MDGDYWIGAGTVLGSILLTVVAQFVAGWAEGGMRRRERRRESRRETLLALQDALDNLAGNGATALVLKARPLLRPSAPKDVRYDDPHAQAALRASIRMTSLAERVPEKGVRESVKRVDDHWRAAVKAQTEKETAEAVEGVRSHRCAATAQIGESFRSL